MEKDGIFDLLPKKEVIGLKKEYEKLNKVLIGIRNMTKLPDALYIVDPSKEEIAIREARKLNIPVFGIVDTNCDPDMVDYVIPGNDDAIRAVKLITGVMANAIVEAEGGKMNNYVKDDDKKADADIMEKALETVKRKEDRPKRFEKKKDFKKKEETEKEVHERKQEVKEEKKAEKVEEKKEVKTSKKKEEKAEENLEKKTVTELRNMAKEKGVKGYSTMKKAELLDALK